MKKILPVYFLLLVLIGSVLFATWRVTKHLTSIESELAGIRSEQVKGTAGPMQPGQAVLRVAVVNTPDVRVENTVDVHVEGEPLDVTVKNSFPIPVEIDR